MVSKLREHTSAIFNPNAGYEFIAAIKQAQERNADEQYDLCCAVWSINNAWAELPGKLTRALDAKYQKAAQHGVAPHVEVVTA
jgi:hypothetical protein